MDENRDEQMSLTPTVSRANDLKRRGMFAMGAALLGAAAAKIATPGQVEAAAGSPLILGTANDAGTSNTSLTANVANENTLSLFTNSPTGNALVGINNSTTTGGGLVGHVLGTGTALAGISDHGIGLSGTSFATTGTDFAGVSGFSQIGFGVRGGTAANSAASPPQTGAGVLGEGGTNAIGVQGTSIGGVAILGIGSVLAGQFNGPVVINGNLNVNGSFTASGIKSAAVPSGNGDSKVLLYCLEAPESLFEDFGEVTMQGGTAAVSIRPDFAQTVDVSTAKIFLTEYGDAGGVYVAGRSSDGMTFALASRTGGSGTIGYRIVAKRDDVQAPRLAPARIPQSVTNFLQPQQAKPDSIPAAAPHR